METRDSGKINLEFDINFNFLWRAGHFSKPCLKWIYIKLNNNNKKICWNFDHDYIS